jgi:pyruvate dehydrogenase (quinone)
MIGINGLVTISERYKDWADPRLVVVVLHNGDLNMVTWEQRVMAGERRFDDSQLLPKFAFAEYARMLGLGGVRIDKPDQIVSAIEQALSADRPTLLEVVTDPNVPPLPPHVSIKQTKAYLKALLQRDPESFATIKATAKEWWDGIRAGKGKGKDQDK